MNIEQKKTSFDSRNVPQSWRDFANQKSPIKESLQIGNQCRPVQMQGSFCLQWNCFTSLLDKKYGCKGQPLSSDLFQNIKVHTFWEGHKFLQNLHLDFHCLYCSSKVRWRFRKILWSSQNIWTLRKMQDL